MRCDVNVSVRLKGEERLRTRVEIKNMNSLTSMQKAIEFETARQVRSGTAAQLQGSHWSCMAGSSAASCAARLQHAQQQRLLQVTLSVHQRGRLCTH